MLYLARGIEDDHYMVVQEVDGALVEMSWRVEREFDGFHLSHADDNLQTELVHELGGFESAEEAVTRLRTFL